MYLFSKIPEQSHSTLMYCTVHVFEKCIFFLLKKRCWISNLQYLPSQLQSNMITTCADDTLIKKETITCSIKPKICRLGQIQNYLILKLEADSKEFNSLVDRVKVWWSKGCRFVPTDGFIFSSLFQVWRMGVRSHQRGKFTQQPFIPEQLSHQPIIPGHLTQHPHF